MRSARGWWAAAVMAAATAGAVAGQGEGLVASDTGTWPRWQGRLSVGTGTPLLHPDTMNVDSGLSVNGASLLGDYYFSRRLQGTGSGWGFRATSGVFLGSRSSSLLWSSQTPGLGGRAFNVDRRSVGGLSVASSLDNNDTSAVPYLGLGYTGMAGKGGWGFSADLGLMALNPGSTVKLGRVFTGGANLDDTLREMRLSPLLQLGLSYSF